MSSVLPPLLENRIILLGVGSATVDFLAAVASYPRPDDKIRSTSVMIQGGGNAGNALACAARLGLKPRLISKVADDSQGKGIVEELEADGVDSSFVVFVKFTEIMYGHSNMEKKEAAFALAALMEIRLQYRAAMTHHSKEKKIAGLGRQPLPPPRRVLDHDNAIKSYSHSPSLEPVGSRSADEKVCPICLKNSRNMAFGCGHLDSLEMINTWQLRSTKKERLEKYARLVIIRVFGVVDLFWIQILWIMARLYGHHFSLNFEDDCMFFSFY